MSAWRRFLARVVRRVAGCAAASRFCVRFTAAPPSPPQPGWELVPPPQPADPASGARVLAALVNGRATVISHVRAAGGAEQCVVVVPRRATGRRG